MRLSRESLELHTPPKHRGGFRRGIDLWEAGLWSSGTVRGRRRRRNRVDARGAEVTERMGNDESDIRSGRTTTARDDRFRGGCGSRSSPAVPPSYQRRNLRLADPDAEPRLHSRHVSRWVTNTARARQRSNTALLVRVVYNTRRFAPSCLYENSACYYRTTRWVSLHQSF